MEILRRLLVEEDGQGITEYALILGLLVLGIWVGIATGALPTAINNLFGRVTTQIDSCISNNCP